MEEFGFWAQRLRSLKHRPARAGGGREGSEGWRLERQSEPSLGCESVVFSREGQPDDADEGGRHSRRGHGHERRLMAKRRLLAEER